jgi:hypothetical protein
MLMVAEKVPATSDTVPIIGKILYQKKTEILIEIYLGIYLTIVMSLTVSSKYPINLINQFILAVDICHNGCYSR